MPAAIAPVLGLTLGIGFAWTASDELARSPGSGITSRAVLVVALFGLLVYAPINAYFLAFAPDWCFAYLVDTHALPDALQLTAVLLDAMSVPIGFAVAARRARLRAYAWLSRALVIGLAVCIVLAGVAMPRLRVVGSFAQYHGDFGLESAAGSTVGHALLWMGAVLLGSIWWTVRSLHLLSRGASRPAG